jgi:hypothetical protein
MTDLTRGKIEQHIIAYKLASKNDSAFPELRDAAYEHQIAVYEALLSAWDALEEAEWLQGNLSADNSHLFTCPVCKYSREHGHHEDCKLSKALPKREET